MSKKTVIGVDASRSNVAQRTGTEYYSYEIIQEILKVAPPNRFFFRLYSKTPLEYLKKSNDVENKVMQFPRLWSQIRLSREIMQNPPSVLFEPSHTIPIIHGKKTVVTLHDVGFKYYPNLYTPLERIYHNFCMKFSVRHATKIISISEATKNDLVKIYKADPKKITVIYHGYDKNKYRQPTKSENPPADIVNLRPYIYFIGRLEAKKNIKKLVSAYGLLRKNPKINHKLVFAGRPGYQYEQIREEIAKLPEKIRKDVIELGYVEDAKTPVLMRYASIFAFPSRFEGFGMPLLEAMASGVPVVGSNTTSIPEILGGSGLVSDPDDIDKLAQNLTKVILDPKTKNGLITKGLERVKKFDWEIAALNTLRVLEDAVNLK